MGRRRAARLCDDLVRLGMVRAAQLGGAVGLSGGEPPLDGVEHQRQVVMERPQPCGVVLDRLSRAGQERSDVRCRRLRVRLDHP
jgi:hypothetical protein